MPLDELIALLKDRKALISGGSAAAEEEEKKELLANSASSSGSAVKKMERRGGLFTAFSTVGLAGIEIKGDRTFEISAKAELEENILAMFNKDFVNGDVNAAYLEQVNKSGADPEFYKQLNAHYIQLSAASASKDVVAEEGQKARMEKIAGILNNAALDKVEKITSMSGDKSTKKEASMLALEGELMKYAEALRNKHVGETLLSEKKMENLLGNLDDKNAFCKAVKEAMIDVKGARKFTDDLEKKSNLKLT